MGLYLQYEQLAATTTRFAALASELAGHIPIDNPETGTVDIVGAITNLALSTSRLADRVATIGVIATEVKDEVTTVDANQNVLYKNAFNQNFGTDRYLLPVQPTTPAPAPVVTPPGTPIPPEGGGGGYVGYEGVYPTLTLPTDLTPSQGTSAPGVDR